MTGPKRVTDKQLAANRANALASTGPRTPAGIAQSRWNALKHGALSKAVIPPALERFEPRPAFDELFDVLREELAPATALEEMLVERIATSYWRLARLLRAEAASVAGRQLRWTKQPPPAVDGDPQTEQEKLLVRAARLTEALDLKQRLRMLMAGEDPRWQKATNAEVQAAARALIADLQRRLAEEDARVEAQQRDMLSIPPINLALLFARYESTLERQIYRALEALERLQRLRAGEALPAPLHLSVDLDVSGGVDAGNQVTTSDI
jgi:hypothetical protein